VRKGKQKCHFFPATNGEVLLSARKRRAHQVKQHALGSAPGLKEAMRTPALSRSAGGTGQRRKAELDEVTFFPSRPPGQRGARNPGYQEFSQAPPDQDASTKTAAHASSITRNLSRYVRTFRDGILACASDHPQQEVQFTFPPDNGTLRIAATTFKWSDIPLVDADGKASAAAGQKKVL